MENNEEQNSVRRKSERISKGVPPARFPSVEPPPVREDGQEIIQDEDHSVPSSAIWHVEEPEKEHLNSSKSSGSKHSIKSKKDKIKRKAKLDAARAKAELEAEEIQQQLDFQERERERDRIEAELQRKAREAKRKLIDEELALQLSDDSQDLGSDDDVRSVDIVDTHSSSSNKESENLEDPNKTLAKSGESKKPEEPVKISRPIASGKKDKMDLILSRQMMDKELPKFEGNPEEWPGFICQYKQSTEDCQLTQSENMNRLRKCLKGKARETVQALLIVPENVDRVISTLEQRFGRPDYIVRTLIDKARKVPSPKEEKWESLLDFANAVQNLAVTLDTLKCQGHLMNPQLLEELVMKLPNHLKYEWGKKVDSGNKGSTTLTEFSEWLETVATAASWIYVPKFPTAERSEKTDLRKGKKFYKDGTILTAVEKSTEKRNDKSIEDESSRLGKCYYCGQMKHMMKNCRKFLQDDISLRWKMVSQKKLCFCCLSPGHAIRVCKRKKRCGVDDCYSFHHPLLHSCRGQEKSKSDDGIQCSSFQVERVVHTMSQKDRMKVILRVVPVLLKGPAGEIKTYALFDEAATVTLLDSDVAKKIGLDGPKDALCLQWTNEFIRKEHDSQTVSLQISGSEKNAKTFKLNGVRTVKKLSLPTQSVDMTELSKKWPYLRNLDVKSTANVKPTILIGQDNVLLTVPRKVVHGPWGAPIATKTWLGWVVHGPEGAKGRIDKSVALHLCHFSDNDPLHELVKESFSTEAFGVKMIDFTPRSKEDRRAEAVMEANTKRIGEHFETGLLWRQENVMLPESKENAFRRLKCIEQKMDKNPEFAQQYAKKIDEYVEKGYVRELSKEAAAVEGPRSWYLPHFAVYNPNKPGKLRLVFDAAAKSHGASLNDYLLKGPDLTSPLTSVLWKFRQKKIGFAGDIREMFHQVFIKDSDLSSQRFLWRGNDRQEAPKVYEMKVMIFGAACSPSLAQYVKNRNAREFQSKFPDACKAVLERHYVDDYLDGADTEEEAVRMIREVSEVHKNGGFDMRNWICSSSNVLESIPREYRANDVSTLNVASSTPDGRVLGLWWNTESDTFTFHLNFPRVNSEIVDGTKQPTKREVLKLVMSVFDPLGFVAHLTNKARILLQDVWRCGIGWDDELPDELYDRWIKWIEELNKIVQVKIPRCYSIHLTTTADVQLHVFCDASEKAFCAVAYLRIAREDDIDTAFVAAKTRVSPLRPMSIPRLELQAAVMASRLARTIQEEHDLNISDVHFWTDSKTVLCWIRNEARRFQPFVAHRVGEIQELTDTHQWHWLSTKENVADEATRDNSPCDFSPESRWFRGPSFLQLEDCLWPTEKKIEEIEVSEEVLEIKSAFVALTRETSIPFPDIQRFSKFQKLIRSTAWLLRFVGNCKARSSESLCSVSGELNPMELDEAEVLWWIQVQKESFPEEVRLLKAGKTIPKSSRLFSLSPELDEKGVIRLRGRTLLSPNISDSAKKPVILDPKHPFTRLLIQRYHEDAGHQGQETVANELRQKYWIISMRAAVKKTCNSCQWCKVKKVRPQHPEMGQLPASRVTGFVRPFTYTGIDYFGPIEVTVGRHHEKRYGVLFTCLTTRAVHLEIASSLTTDSAIMAIRRMVGRRGFPKEIFSDNGTNLHGADNELKAALRDFNQERLTSEMTSKGIKWNFIPPSSPHMGGSWERLVRSVKSALRTTLKERAPKEEVLQTLFVEAEHSVNSRPLTHVPVDAKEPESLTPNHFLLGSSSGVKQAGIFTDHDLCTRSQWRFAQKLSDLFWNRWVKEYLPTLTRRSKWCQQTIPIKVGDVVLIADNSGPRNSWPIGLVTNVFPGRDGIVRVVDVKTSSGIYRRPVVKLCVLDVETKDM